LSRDLRAFGFGIVAFNVTQEKWNGEIDEVLEFLCRTFADEPDPRLTMQYLYSLVMIFNYCDAEYADDKRQAVRRRLAACLDNRSSLGIGGGPAPEPSLEQQFQTLRAKHLQH
jgi:hypothetical protein